MLRLYLVFYVEVAKHVQLHDFLEFGVCQGCKERIVVIGIILFEPGDLRNCQAVNFTLCGII